MLRTNRRRWWWGVAGQEGRGELMLAWPRIFIDNFRNFNDKAKAEVMPFAARLRKGQQQQQRRRQHGQ